MTQTDQIMAFIERRHSPRRRALLVAQIVFRNGNCSIGCAIINHSKTGATLQPFDVGSCPDQFELVSRREAPRRCEVIWRKGDLLGVRYIDVRPLQPSQVEQTVTAIELNDEERRALLQVAREYVRTQHHPLAPHLAAISLAILKLAAA